MSFRKLSLTMAVGATLALSACSFHETLTQSVSTESHTINGGTAVSSLDMSRNQGATGSSSAGGSVTRTMTLERNGFEPWHEVR